MFNRPNCGNPNCKICQKQKTKKVKIDSDLFKIPYKTEVKIGVDFGLEKDRTVYTHFRRAGQNTMAGLLEEIRKEIEFLNWFPFGHSLPSSSLSLLYRLKTQVFRYYDQSIMSVNHMQKFQETLRLIKKEIQESLNASDQLSKKEDLKEEKTLLELLVNAKTDRLTLTTITSTTTEMKPEKSYRVQLIEE